MSFSMNSIIFVIPGPVSTEWFFSSIQIIFPYSFESLEIFDGISGIVNFIFLGAKYIS